MATKSEATVGVPPEGAPLTLTKKEIERYSRAGRPPVDR